MKVSTSVKKSVEKALSDSAAQAGLSISDRDIPAVLERTLRELEPALEHISNDENWYRSRVTWGAIFSAIGALCAIFGVPFAEEMQNQVVDLIMAIVAIGGLVLGPALTLWGRYVAKKPIGK